MRNFNFKELEKPAVPAVIAGAATGAHYGNSWAWTAGGVIIALAILLAAYWADKKRESRSKNLESHGPDSTIDK